MTAVRNWRTVTLALVLGLALLFAVNARPAGAHNERQLHRALRALDARIDRQADRITNLRNLVNSDFVLLSCTFDATWDILNQEGALTFEYPNLDACDSAARAAGSLRLDATARLLEERMR